MGRGGFRGGGRSRDYYSPGNSGSNSLARGAAASRGFRSSFYRWWSEPVGADAWRCRGHVITYELLAIHSRKRGGKDSNASQSFLKEFEDSCAEFKPYWSDWWSTDKERFIESFVNSYYECLRNKGKDNGECRFLKETLGEGFGVEVD